MSKKQQIRKAVAKRQPPKKARITEPDTIDQIIADLKAAEPSNGNGEIADKPLTPDVVADAKQRVAACNAELVATLAKYHCRIVSYLLEPVPVGAHRDCVQITASYGIIPDPVQ